MLHGMGHAHPVSCVDCHDSERMQLCVTRPGFIRGIQMLAESDAPVPYLPSIEQWRTSGRTRPYEPNFEATRTEMRSFVCGQCHVEYFCASNMKLTFPWGERVEGRGDREILGRHDGPQRRAVLRLCAQGVGGENPQGATPGIRALELGYPRPQWSGLC